MNENWMTKDQGDLMMLHGNFFYLLNFLQGGYLKSPRVRILIFRSMERFSTQTLT